MFVKGIHVHSLAVGHSEVSDIQLIDAMILFEKQCCGGFSY